MDVTMVICLLALGAVAGFAAGLLGIGGGMLLVPFLTMRFAWKGMPADLVVHAAIATSMTSILFTSISSVRAHQQKGTIKWPIVWAMAPGIILGGLLSGGAVFAALSTCLLYTSQDHVEERAVHRLAHDVREDGAGRAHQRAGDDQHRVVEREADARRRPARIAVQHRHHHGHVRAADRGDDHHAQHEGCLLYTSRCVEETG